MGIRKYKPTSPGRRVASVSTFEEITKSKPEKSLTRPMKKKGGRNNTGRITCRHRGGGHKRRYRIIDFKRDKVDIPAKVASIEYDPNRSARIALLFYADGEKRYILAPLGLKVGQVVMSGDKVDCEVGNTLPLKNIPNGQIVHNVELHPGRGGQLARSAGTQIRLSAKEGGTAHLIMPSGEVRKVQDSCRATIGQIGNMDHMGVRWGKAGRTRWHGIRPTVRGTAMNPVSHPMGGGEGRRGGGRHPCSPWGKPAKGGKTRNSKKASSKNIIRSRKRGRFQF